MITLLSLNSSDSSCAVHLIHGVECFISVLHITLATSDVNIMVVICWVYYFDILIFTIHFTLYINRPFLCLFVCCCFVDVVFVVFCFVFCLFFQLE